MIFLSERAATVPAFGSLRAIEFTGNCREGWLFATENLNNCEGRNVCVWQYMAPFPATDFRKGLNQFKGRGLAKDVLMRLGRSIRSNRFPGRNAC